MRKISTKSKAELTKLANILISKHRVLDFDGSDEFLSFALLELRINKDIDVNKQTVRLHLEWLINKCKALELKDEDFDDEEEDEEVCRFGDDNDLYNYYGDVAEDTFVIQKAIEIMSRYLNDKTTNFTPQQQQYFPDYSMFVEGEDGLMVIKGSYKGKTLDEIDEVNFKGAKRGWAKWCLDNDKNLTDDDRDVFTKIMMNQL